jgi:hypothetical protein
MSLFCKLHLPCGLLFSLFPYLLIKRPRGYIFGDMALSALYLLCSLALVGKR